MISGQWSERGRESVRAMQARVAARSFRELVVWQKSMDLATTVYRMTRQFPRDEMYGLANQIRRCAVSVPSNIAEGQGRMSSGEFRQFLGIARGSNFELQTQIELVRRLGLGDARLVDEADELSHEVGKMIYAILDKIRA